MLTVAPLEQLLVAHLRPVLGVHVGTRVPDPRPERFVRLMRTGGAGRRNLAQSDATVLVECWGATGKESDLWALTERAWAGISGLDHVAGQDWAATASLTDPVNFPDASTGAPRYQFIASITTNLKELA